MENFKETVPFDPGYSKISFSFLDGIGYLAADYSQLKTPQQKKFRLMQVESKIVDLINKSSAFYLGCMLWGGFLSSRFKNNPKEITGNHTNKLSKEELKDYDCTQETNLILAYIEAFDKDCKYYLKKPSKVSKEIIDILKNYEEFAKANKHFTNVSKTSDIILPKPLKHFDKLSEKDLDELYEKIKTVIDTGKIEGLLEIGYYKK